MSRSKTPSAALALAASTEAGAASPEHKRFRSLLQRIEKERARLAAWQRELPLFTRAYQERVEPAERELTALRREWAFELEQILNSQRWPRQDAQTLAELIAANALATMEEQSAHGRGDDAELEALYDRHAEQPLAAERAAELDGFKRMVESTTGMPFERMDGDSIDEVMQQVSEHLQQAQAEQQAELEAREARRAERQARRRAERPPQPNAAQRKAQEAQARISQTVREVYRKLASALHPDRLTTAGDEARAVATERMQRANSAYEAGDLLTLLSLQLEIEQVDARQVAGIAADQVKHFNRVLAEQLKELEREVAEREFSFIRSYDLEPGRRLDPTQLGKLPGELLAAVNGAKQRIAYDRRTLRGPPTGARGLLKAWRADQRRMDERRALDPLGL